jgi:phosphoribosylformimino-5-aminoimidazole carboxamide ribotide isomerase
MQVWPAIDLRGGKCVRLAQGDFGRETVYGDDPAEVARRFKADGAEYLHVVDLDAARSGKPANTACVRSIVSSVGMTCELGGGVRDDEAIERLLAIGLDRLVVGTAALRKPDWFRAACRRWPARLVLGLDARDGCVATDGWLETTDRSAVEVAREFAAEPMAAIVYTDIATDGMLSGPNVPAVRAMCEAVDLPVIASGGVKTADDVRQLAQTGAAGCIIGRAIYEGTINVRAALRAAGELGME